MKKLILAIALVVLAASTASALSNKIRRLRCENGEFAQVINDRWSCVAEPVGQVGPQGPAGLDGLDGPQGPQGIPGPNILPLVQSINKVETYPKNEEVTIFAVCPFGTQVVSASCIMSNREDTNFLTGVRVGLHPGDNHASCSFSIGNEDDPSKSITAIAVCFDPS